MAVRVLTMGTFDLIHTGHVGLFAQCRTIAGAHGQVIVGVNSDEFVTQYKGRPPVIPLAHRLAVVGQLRDVDEAHPNEGGEAQPALIEATAPDVIAVGDDWADRDYLAQINVTPAWLDRHGITVRYLPRTGPYSSGHIRKTSEEHHATQAQPH